MGSLINIRVQPPDWTGSAKIALSSSETTEATGGLLQALRRPHAPDENQLPTAKGPRHACPRMLQPDRGCPASSCAP
jgi:hypothetical protein